MDNTFIKTIIDKLNKLNIAFLAKVALVLTGAGYFIWMAWYSTISYAFVPWLSGMFFQIIPMAINLSPYILLVLFFSRYRERIKISVIVAIIFGVFAINNVIMAFDYFYWEPVLAIINILVGVLCGGVVFCSIYFRKYYDKLGSAIIIPIIFMIVAIAYMMLSFKYLMYYSGSSWGAIYLALAVLFVISTIGALKGFSNNILVIVALSVGVLVKIVNLFDFLPEIINYFIIYDNPLYVFEKIATILGEGVLYFALLLFVLRNKVPDFITILRGERKPSPEQELKLLKEKFEFGILTEEEYQAQRAEIISKL